MTEIVIVTKSEEETVSLGRKLGRFLSGGDVVALEGDLGAGKSVMVRGICEGLGIRQRTRSPSYTFVNRYRGPVDVFHVDLYRIDSREALESLGWEDAISSRGVTLIEWSEKLGVALPPPALRIVIEMTGEERRTIRISSYNERCDAGVAALAAERRCCGAD